MTSKSFAKQFGIAAVALFVTSCSDPASPDPLPEKVTGKPSSLASLTGTLAFVSTRDGKPHIYLTSLDASGITRLTNSTEAEFTPAWSPDGQHLAFNRDDGTFVIRRDGSEPVRLPVGGATPSWSPDGKRLLVSTKNGLRSVSADGSGDEIAIDPRPPYGGYSNPDFSPWGAKWSPDGSRIVFSSWTSLDFERAFLMNADGTEVRTFINPLNHAIWDECAPVWSPDGTRIALLGGIFGSQAFMQAYFGVGIVDPAAGNVTTVYAPGTTCWDSSNGVTTSSGIAWSPDGKGLAITRRTPGWVQGLSNPTSQEASIVVIDIGTKTILTVLADAYDPTWTSAR